MKVNGYHPEGDEYCENCRRVIGNYRFIPRNYPEPKPGCCSSDCAKAMELKHLERRRVATGAIN